MRVVVAVVVVVTHSLGSAQLQRGRHLVPKRAGVGVMQNSVYTHINYVWIYCMQAALLLTRTTYDPQVRNVIQFEHLN